RAVDPEVLLRALGELRPRARLDDNDVARTVADQQTVHVHRDPVAVVRGLFLLPQRFRDDAEHRAAIEPEDAVAEDLDLETTDAHDKAVWESVERRRSQGKGPLSASEASVLRGASHEERSDAARRRREAGGD